MDQSLIFWPMIAHVVLIMIVYLELGRRRYLAGKAGQIRYSDYRVVGAKAEPESCGKAARNIVNNFELPMLFHIVAMALFLTNLASLPQLVLAWLFVISRYLHSLVHLTGNNVKHRAAWFFLGFFVLAAMWVLFALSLSADTL